MKRISFSLWGDSKLYCKGALENIALCHEHYYGWIPRFYVAENCPALPDIEWEARVGNCELVVMEPTTFVWGSTCAVDKHHDQSHLNMIWRYEAVFDKNVDICLFRDCDSRLNAREADSVQEWVENIDLWAGHSIYERQVHHDNGGVMPGTSGLNACLWQTYGNLNTYREATKKFVSWYATEGYNRGLRFVHYDIWHYRYFFFDVMKKMGAVMQCGHGTNRPLRVPVGAGGEVGSTIHEGWRYETYGELL